MAGALAISSLAAMRISVGLGSDLRSEHFSHPFRITGSGLLALALVTYLVLAVGEIRWFRPHFDLRRWAAVFPLGMAVAACLTVASATSTPALRVFAELLLWPTSFLCLLLWGTSLYRYAATVLASARPQR